MPCWQWHAYVSFLPNPVHVLSDFQHNDRLNPSPAEFWNPGHLAYKFLAEARRLLELEPRRPKLTTVQATLVLHFCYDMNETGELGCDYLRQAVEMANELTLFKTCEEGDERWQNACGFAALAFLDGRHMVKHLAMASGTILTRFWGYGMYASTSITMSG
jgi:hypothetical protein